jgi:hypothetical protein
MTLKCRRCAVLAAQNSFDFIIFVKYTVPCVEGSAAAMGRTTPKTIPEIYADYLQRREALIKALTDGKGVNTNLLFSALAATHEPLTSYFSISVLQK